MKFVTAETCSLQLPTEWELTTEIMKHAGVPDIFLWATSTNRALNLYKRHGYEIVEESSCCWDCCLWCTMGERKGFSYGLN
ncbi:hypothetical protein KUTeg_007411 [Tegillarca granosa]|uniref:Uncharacterized protein n=1 Tax=Tegillarca granosa TaxID=220873 RepID=A0ABQ9FD83_TEGGR|nr:hypothetical protein KUTeg_007411 [Tegillarca granosa]